MYQQYHQGVEEKMDEVYEAFINLTEKEKEAMYQETLKEAIEEVADGMQSLLLEVYRLFYKGSANKEEVTILLAKVSNISGKMFKLEKEVNKND